jgi:hypothetical protein
MSTVSNIEDDYTAILNYTQTHHHEEEIAGTKFNEHDVVIRAGKNTCGEQLRVAELGIQLYNTNHRSIFSWQGKGLQVHR